jgi:hypothetical protein
MVREAQVHGHHTVHNAVSSISTASTEEWEGTEQAEETDSGLNPADFSMQWGECKFKLYMLWYLHLHCI